MFYLDVDKNVKIAYYMDVGALLFPLTDRRDINGRVVSFPLTNMRDIKGWFKLTSDAGVNFLHGDRMKERGFYNIKDAFFADFPDPFLKGNKDERRPHYFALRDEKSGLIWMIPMSSRVEKYQAIMDKRKAGGRPCDTLHICRLDNGILNVFLLQDMFPITKEYIASEYTIHGNQLMLTSDKEAEAVLKKAKRTLNMIRRGVRFTPTQPDVLAIETKLRGTPPQSPLVTASPI